MDQKQGGQGSQKDKDNLKEGQGAAQRDDKTQQGNKPGQQGGQGHHQKDQPQR